MNSNEEEENLKKLFENVRRTEVDLSFVQNMAHNDPSERYRKMAQTCLDKASDIDHAHLNATFYLIEFGPSKQLLVGFSPKHLN